MRERLSLWWHGLTCRPNLPAEDFVGELWQCPRCGRCWRSEHVPDILMTTEMLPMDCGDPEWVRSN